MLPSNAACRFHAQRDQPKGCGDLELWLPIRGLICGLFQRSNHNSKIAAIREWTRVVTCCRGP
jgi:hypothetical protein